LSGGEQLAPFAGPNRSPPGAIDEPPTYQQQNPFDRTPRSPAPPELNEGFGYELPRLPVPNLENRTESPNRHPHQQPVNPEVRLGLVQLRSAEVVAQQWSGTKYFDNISAAAARDPQAAIDYARKLAMHRNPEQQEQVLESAIDNYPDNPYFRIYLADIYLGEAAKPIIQKFDSTWRLQIMPRDVDYINKAMTLLGQAQALSHRELNQLQHREADAPGILSPYVIHNPNSDTQRFLFYFGASVQARNRQIAIGTLAQKLNLRSSR
jgi:hypothetical protein